MKKIIFLVIMLVTLSIYSQNGYTIIIDGKEVFVEDNAAISSVIPTIATPNINSAQSDIHIVKHGETLYSISRLYNLTVDELCSLNNIDKKTFLDEDQSLRVVNFSKTAANFSNASYHIVKKEDTLYNISKRYGLSVPKLKELNNLNSNLISINQRLRVN